MKAVINRHLPYIIIPKKSCVEYILNEKDPFFIIMTLIMVWWKTFDIIRLKVEKHRVSMFNTNTSNIECTLLQAICFLIYDMSCLEANVERSLECIWQGRYSDIFTFNQMCRVIAIHYDSCSERNKYNPIQYLFCLECC